MLVLAVVFSPLPVHGETEDPPEINSTGPCMGEGGFSRAWLDRVHTYLARSLCQPSVWFDNFFGEQRASEEWPGSLVRWTHEYRLDQRDGGTYRSELDASVRLPKTNKRFKLIIASENRDSGSINQPNSDPYDLDPPSTGDNKAQTNAGLRYTLAATRHIKANIGFGARLDSPIDPYVRVRLRITKPLGSTSLVRITPAAIWYRDRGLGRSVNVDLERRVGENILLRASQSGVWKEGEPGILWGTEFSFLERLTPQTVFNVKVGARGKTQPFVHTELYRVAMKLRSDFLRPWLFLEVEPELYWPRDDEGHYRKYHALTLRVEVQFFS